MSPPHAGNSVLFDDMRWQVGAQPTDTVARLLSAAKLAPPPPVRNSRKTIAESAAKAAASQAYSTYTAASFARMLGVTCVL
jgi:hypothetical protein